MRTASGKRRGIAAAVALAVVTLGPSLRIIPTRAIDVADDQTMRGFVRAHTRPRVGCVPGRAPRRTTPGMASTACSRPVRLIESNHTTGIENS